MTARVLTPLIAAGLLIVPVAAEQEQQPASQLSAHQRGQARRMLSTLKAAIRQDYYDAAFRGIDLEAHFKAAEAKIDDARSWSHAYGIIAQALIAFDDSHTYFMPPKDSTTVEYGWDLRMIGDACYIIAVRPGSDAEAKGLTPGDRVLQIDQFVPARRDLWKLRYLLYTLSRRPMVRMVVQGPGAAAPRTLEIASKVTRGSRVISVSFDDLEDMVLDEFREARASQNRFGRAGGVAIWKLSGFAFNPDDVDKVMDRGIGDASALVIDMRGNGGGYIKTLEEIAGRLFDREVTIGNIRTRKSSKPFVAKKRKGPFAGPIVAIVDADSGSAAEILARLLQIEKRGTVIGDRSAGAVMQGKVVAGDIPNANGVMFYYASVTNAELVMADGRSLEKVGVAPDEHVLPTGLDLAAGRDPVLARAVALAGGSLDPAAAGAMFPVEWQSGGAGK